MRLANHTPKDGVKNVAKKIQKSSVVRGLEKKAVDYGTKALRDVAEPAVDALADTAATALGNPELAAPLDLAIHKGADYLQRKGADYLDQKIDSDGPLLSSDAPVLSSDGPLLSSDAPVLSSDGPLLSGCRIEPVHRPLSLVRGAPRGRVTPSGWGVDVDGPLSPYDLRAGHLAQPCEWQGRAVGGS
jgi:hypothetical protein